MTFIILIISFFYILLIGGFVIGFKRTPVFLNEKLPPETTFSLIIPFRNEANNLPLLINSIKHLNYPKHLYECILVNDDSNDDSASIITEMFKNTPINFCIIKNTRISNSPKKDAITKAINLAKNKWIITTDADCILPKLWLDTFDCFIQKKDVVFIAGPVNYYHANSFFTRFQSLDFMSLIGATIGGFGLKKPFLCNGANLAYKKDFFLKNEGFLGNNTIASGDDIFLLEKALKVQPNSVLFLKNCNVIVLTQPEPTLTRLISQRVRWASKTVNYNNWFGKCTGLIVLFMNTLIVTSLLLSIFKIVTIVTFSTLFLIKFAIDFLLLFKTSRFFSNEKLLRSFFLSSMIYPFFSLFIVFKSLFFSYNWKGRQFYK